VVIEKIVTDSTLLSSPFYSYLTNQQRIEKHTRNPDASSPVIRGTPAQTQWAQSTVACFLRGVVVLSGEFADLRKEREFGR
jgi:hypothetical protein